MPTFHVMLSAKVSPVSSDVTSTLWGSEGAAITRKNAPYSDTPVQFCRCPQNCTNHGGGGQGSRTGQPSVIREEGEVWARSPPYTPPLLVAYRQASHHALEQGEKCVWSSCGYKTSPRIKQFSKTARRRNCMPSHPSAVFQQGGI